MPNLNYRKGASFERRFVNDLLDDRRHCKICPRIRHQLRKEKTEVNYRT